MRERSDEALVADWSGGSMAAFEALYARYRGPLYRYFLRLSGDAARANDLYQGCWEKVIRARRRYRPTGPFRAWLFRIAHNHAMDDFRRSAPLTGLDDADAASTQPDPADHAVAAERAALAAAEAEEGEAAAGEAEARKQALAEKEAEYAEKFANPYRAARRGFIDEVILPKETRRKLIKGFASLNNKEVDQPRRKHGNIPL